MNQVRVRTDLTKVRCEVGYCIVVGECKGVFQSKTYSLSNKRFQILAIGCWLHMALLSCAALWVLHDPHYHSHGNRAQDWCYTKCPTPVVRCWGSQRTHYISQTTEMGHNNIISLAPFLILVYRAMRYITGNTPLNFTWRGLVLAVQCSKISILSKIYHSLTNFIQKH